MDDKGFFIGSTSILTRIRSGVLLKSPLKPSTDNPRFKDRVRLAFSVEEPILLRLGDHPRIVQYLGRQEDGILLGEASRGSLEAYLCAENSSITLDQRKVWCRQAIEAIVYIHGYGVVHADMRPENFLVHERSPGCLDILLCDFGGAKCDELGLCGNQLPDGPFYDPAQGTDPSPALDIFSLGSILYTILTGFWPYRPSSGPFSSLEEMLEYVANVDKLFCQKQYPSIAGLVGGKVIMGCWTKKYKYAEDVLTAWDREVMFIVDEE